MMSDGGPQREQELARLRAVHDQLRSHAEDLTHQVADLTRDLDQAQKSEVIARAQLNELQHDHQQLADQHAKLIELVANKQESIEFLLRRMFGTKRERFVAGQQVIAAVAALIADAELGATDPVPNDDALAGRGADDQQGKSADPASTTIPKPANPPRQSHQRPAGSGGRKPLPADLPRHEQQYTPPANHPDLVDADAIRLIGHATIELLDVTPCSWSVASISCPIMEITKGDCTMQVTVRPPAIINRGQVTDQALITTVVDKHADHLPYYRQQQRAARQDVDLPRSKLSRWQQSLADFLEPVYDEQLVALFEEPCLGIDDSVMRRWDLREDTGRCAQGRLWEISGLAGWYYIATDTREAKWISELLEPYSGAVMGDACASHKPLLERHDILALFCWAHVRRKFFESPEGPERDEMMTLIQRLYAVEAAIKGWPPDEVTFHRRRHAMPVLTIIKERLIQWMDDPQVLPASALGKAVRYAHGLWDGLVRYVDLPYAPIDNNDTERGMRPNAMHRKNALFHASEAGAKSYAVIQTLVHSAMKLGLDPMAYLSGVVEALHAGADPTDLVPVRWKAGAGRQDSAGKRALG